MMRDGGLIQELDVFQIYIDTIYLYTFVYVWYEGYPSG